MVCLHPTLYCNNYRLFWILGDSTIMHLALLHLFISSTLLLRSLWWIVTHDVTNGKRLNGLEFLNYFLSTHFLSDICFLIFWRSRKKSFNYICRHGVDFTKIKCTAFARTDPKSAKNAVKLSVFFALLGSARIKAACKMLVQSIPSYLIGFQLEL